MNILYIFNFLSTTTTTRKINKNMKFDFNRVLFLIFNLIYYGSSKKNKKKLN